MPYLIDGHNLIPKIPHLNLAAIDDEQQLIELLQEFSRRARKQVEVYFDDSGSAQTRVQRFGIVVAHFVRQGRTADDAIRARLERLGNNARNWVVISSDLSVQGAARNARARYLSSEAFAHEMAAELNASGPEKRKESEAALSADEVAEWLDIFGVKPPRRSNPR